MKKFKITVDGKTYNVEVEEVREGVQPSSKPVSQAQPRPTAPAPSASVNPNPAGGNGGVTAPMPGTILRILVTEGQKVELGQTVAILEAMKMENNINANATGTVSSIQVNPGQSVDTGQLLLTIE